MKKAVACLTTWRPTASPATGQGRILLATVRATSTTSARTSSWCWAATVTVIDAGVMVPAPDLEEARRHEVQALGLSADHPPWTRWSIARRWSARGFRSRWWRGDHQPDAHGRADRSGLCWPRGARGGCLPGGGSGQRSAGPRAPEVLHRGPGPGLRKPAPTPSIQAFGGGLRLPGEGPRQSLHL